MALEAQVRCADCDALLMDLDAIDDAIPGRTQTAVFAGHCEECDGDQLHLVLEYG